MSFLCHHNISKKLVFQTELFIFICPAVIRLLHNTLYIESLDTETAENKFDCISYFNMTLLLVHGDFDIMMAENAVQE